MLYDLADYARLLNIILCVFALAKIAWTWREFVRAARDVWFLRMAIVGFTLATLVGSIEGLAHPGPLPGTRSLLFTFSLVWVLIALRYARMDNNSKE